MRRLADQLTRWKTLGVFAVAAAGLGVWSLPTPGSGVASLQIACAEEPDADALAARVEDLRKRMQGLYLEVERDHARVREETFPQAVAAADFAGALTALVAAARAEAETEPGVLVTRTIDPLVAAGAALPLSRTSLERVLAGVVTAARLREDVSDADALFLETARVLFAPGSAADVWDAHFQDIAVVLEFRAAGAALAAALAAAKEPQGPRPGDPGTEADMVFLDRGRGQVGPWRGWVQTFSEKQNRRQMATLKPLYVDRYEVSCAQYAAFLGELKSGKRAELLPEGWKLAEDGAVTVPDGQARHPVTGVTYAQALAYARHWGKRLPTENEWELAAAGLQKEGRVFPWGAEMGEAKVAGRGAVSAPVDVDAFPDDATPEGIVGMAGNVAEYVATLPDRAAAPRARPPKGDEIVIRGGSFKARPGECSTNWRWVADPAAPHAHIGFRCVMEQRDYKRRFGD